MRLRTKFTLTMPVIAITAFLMAPMAPLGSLLWNVPAGGPEPSSGQVALFMLYTAIVCVALGFGASYWAYGYSVTQRFFPRLTPLAHLALGYIPASFWLHDNLHLVNGMNVNGLIAIEYLFHVPMMLAGVALAAATLLGARARHSGPGYAALG